VELFGNWEVAGGGGRSGEWLLFDLQLDPEERVDLLAGSLAHLDQDSADARSPDEDVSPPLPWAAPPWSVESLVALKKDMRRELEAHGERTAPALSWVTPGDPRASPALHHGYWVPWLEPTYA